MKKTIPTGGSGITGYLLLAGLLVLILGLGFWGGQTWWEGTPPELELQPPLKVLGAEQPCTLIAKDENSGLSHLRLILRQGERQQIVLDKSFPGSRWRGGTDKVVELPLTLTPKAWGFQDGPAELQLEIRDYSWRQWWQGNARQLSHAITIDLTPLRLSFISGNEYLNQGGTGLVVYQVNKKVARSGILVEQRFFTGYPLPGDTTGKHLVFFAMPFEFPKPPTLELMAEDEGGQQAKVRLTYRLKSRRWRSDKIMLSEAFLTRKMPEFQEYSPELQGLHQPLEVFLRINQQEREKNARMIQEICARSGPEPLWQGPFLRLPNSKPMAGFADHRTYIYQGREVDRQVHLGQDLASLERALVPAGNHGVVVFAGLLGIYGQTVILDHGQGLFSMYSHLSEIKVSREQKVNKGEELGRTGTTGLAGGDHLHFSIIIQGDFVNPIEWWDPHWLKDQVYRQLALSPAPPAPSPTAKPARSRPSGSKRPR